MTRIKLDNIVKEFTADNSTIVAVDNVSMDIRDGEFLVLVGPSGCGKTTTLRCIAGLESVTDGTVKFNDDNVTDLRSSDRDVSMVFQNYALYPHMSVRKNIGFGLRMSTKLSSEDINTRVTEAAEMLGISDLMGKKPKELSGGQQQRVALGRAIVRDPRVFLMDEPLSNLDAKLRTQMRTEIQELQNDLDITTVYVTHDQTEAMAMGDRIAVLNDGMIQQVGRPEELYREPVNEFVANFIGDPSINLFTATVDGDALQGPGDLHINLNDSTPVSGHREVRVGIRPEDIHVTEHGNHTATVSVVEQMGNENFLYVDVSDHEFTFRSSSTIQPNEGEQVSFTFDEQSLYIFDADTGETLKMKSSIEQAPSLENSSSTA